MPETESPDQRVRPGVVRWVGYAMGAGLPPRHRTWVLHDTTTRTWVLRHVARSLVQLAVPIALVLLVVPGPFWIRGLAALGGLILGLAFSIAYMPEATENRVKKAGYRAGTAQAVRDRSSAERQVRDTERRRAAAARRAARYRDRRSG
ncbi:hypothetical protein LY71_10998 [Geodermatophilus tzadiensis]|uniref:DUF5313 domain-containing protein n=1 Tax=Geodermatophilus tzadiensis TaxID=1137988 RepID=A0A2T0TS23_9ACTN|nr:DUF5313 family protein [Geodermatophilus tzadiensis]PRY48461.1 hypothetical protein LY71_10998 [Geodermatophilus tzadiensis]